MLNQTQLTPEIHAIALQSGSNGNCIYVDTGGVRLLFDAGIGGRTARARLAAFGRDIRLADAVLVSHDHSDHVRSAGVFNRMFGLSLYMTPETRRHAAARMGSTGPVNTFAPGETLTFDGVTVETMPTPHDGADGVAFVVETEGRRLGVLTDLGYVFPELRELVGSLDGLFLESNYDADMLELGSYPAFLKDRIRGRGGHISNLQAAHLLKTHAGPRLRWACLAHLSENNNSPDIARETWRRVVGDRFPLHLASRYEPRGVFSL